MERVKEMRRKGWEGGKGTPAFFVFARNPLSPPPLQEELSTLPSVLTPNVILLTNERRKQVSLVPQMLNNGSKFLFDLFSFLGKKAK